MSMNVTFGKHSGKSVEELVLKDPSYISWVLKQSASGAMLAVKNHAKTLIEKFDAKPFQLKCHSCKANATWATVYMDNVAPYWWCDSCDPYQLGANSGKLQSIRTYGDAARHVEHYCTAQKSCHTELVKHLARAKGLPTRVTAQALASFFA